MHPGPTSEETGGGRVGRTPGLVVGGSVLGLCLLLGSLARPVPADEEAVRVRPGDVPVRVLRPDGRSRGAGVEVRLVDPATDREVARAVTNAHGETVLPDVREGDYHLAFGEARLALRVTPFADARRIALVGTRRQLGLPARPTAAGAGAGWMEAIALSGGLIAAAGGATGIALGFSGSSGRDAERPLSP